MSSKDPSYPLRRLSYALRKRAIDRWFPRPGLSRHASLRTVDGKGIRTHFMTRRAPRWHFRSSEIPFLVARIPERVRLRTVTEAQGIVEGRFDIAGHGPVTFPAIDWDLAPQGDVVWTRELNRHTAFEQLGFAFHYTGDVRFADTFVRLSQSWIESHGNRIGRLGWDTPFQVGRRINSWIWAFFLFLEWEGWDEEARRAYLRTLGLLTEYLYQTREYHSPGNHILLEVKALALCAETFPEFAGAGRWGRKAWETLGREIDAQVCSDGVHAERATMYHRAIAGELAELWLFCVLNGLPPAERLGEVVNGMANFQRWIDLGNGDYPLFGDSRARDSYYRVSAPVLAAERSGRQTPLEHGVSDHTWWLARDLRSTFSGPDPSLRRGACAFPEGGYYVSRSAGREAADVLVWDCGPIGYAANRNHGHADALSFVLSVAGEPVIIDPGVGGPRHDGTRPARGEITALAEQWSDMRATSAHNTVVVDGEDQAILGDRREIWDPPLPRATLWATTNDFDVMRGQHDGYARLADPVIHDRLILASRFGYWIIVDYLRGREVHQVDAYYHFAPGSTVETVGSEGAFRVLKGSAEIELQFFGGEQSGFQVRELERTAEVREGVPDRLKALQVSWRRPLPILLGTLVTIPARKVEVQRLLPQESRVEVELDTAAGLDRVTIRMDERPIEAPMPVVEIERVDARLASTHHWAFGGSTTVPGIHCSEEAGPEAIVHITVKRSREP